MTVKNLYKNEDEEKPLKLADTSSGYTPEKPAGFDDSAYQAKKPTYASSYDDRIDSLLDSLENRPEFRYDAESDPLYRQYESQYRREGQRAADDTLASAAVHAGGMNSYAVTAAQQAGDYYNAKLMEALPELTQLAYQMYQADYDEDVNALKLLQSQEAEAYERYQDKLSDWYAELESAYQQYRDSVADSKWQQDFDYEKEQDALTQQNWQTQFDYEKEQDALAYQKWLEQFNYGKEQDAIDNQYRQDAFDYEKEQDALAYQQWLEQMAYQKQQDALTNALRYLQYTPQEDEEPVYIEPETPVVSGKDPYAGTDYYRDAIEAAQRGDRAAAEAALAKRAEKMASPDYHGTGGGTSMEEARAYVESLLAGTEEPSA